MNIAIVGASGYIGTNLIDELLNNTDHNIVAISRNAESINLNSNKLKKINVNIFNEHKMQQSLTNIDCVFYLVHMMAQKKLDFTVAEAKAANIILNITKRSNIKRIIYLGGLGNDADNLSRHLTSRHHTGEILRNSPGITIEFRASMVIGKGSISYDIITNLVHKLPIITIPKWSETLTQPIGIKDAINYLVSGILLDINHSEIIEIGGPEQVSYRNLMRRYAIWKGHNPIIVELPIIPVGIAAWWLNLFTPKIHAKVGRSLVESLANPMIVTNDNAHKLFPEIVASKLEDVFV
jgi:uncharacterized protein YbjT (DUF2867 family)